jgi:hypothetical protein
MDFSYASHSKRHPAIGGTVNPTQLSYSHIIDQNKADPRQTDQNDYHFAKTLKALHIAQKSSADYRYVRKYQAKRNASLLSRPLQSHDFLNKKNSRSPPVKTVRDLKHSKDRFGSNT